MPVCRCEYNTPSQHLRVTRGFAELIIPGTRYIYTCWHTYSTYVRMRYDIHSNRKRPLHATRKRNSLYGSGPPSLATRTHIPVRTRYHTHCCCGTQSMHRCRHADRRAGRNRTPTHTTHHRDIITRRMYNNWCTHVAGCKP